jgi:4'-phosphopantetheinyl transferase
MVNVYGVKLLDELLFLEMRGIFHACLPKVVCDAAAGYKFSAGRQRKILGEMLLRGILHREFNINPNQIKTDLTTNGKPVLLSHPEIHFNISHSGQWVVVAFSSSQVGVDVEKIRKVNLNIARRFFSEEENRALFSLPANKQTDYFFDLWTLKESFLKALGTGLTKPLKSFTVMRSGETYRLSGSDAGRHFRMKQLHIDRGYKLSVCSIHDKISEHFSVLYINDLLELLI